jgi:hypothetical protein
MLPPLFLLLLLPTVLPSILAAVLGRRSLLVRLLGTTEGVVVEMEG